MTPPPATADLCDRFIGHVHDALTNDTVRVLQPLFRRYGGKPSCCGQASTVRCFESNVTVGEVLQSSGAGRVLVVDAGGSLRCGMLGDNLAAAAIRNGWQGVIVNGCIRDSGPLGSMQLCVRALNTHPVKSTKASPGQTDVPVSIAGAVIRPGDWVYVDDDGIVVSSGKLTLHETDAG